MLLELDSDFFENFIFCDHGRKTYHEDITNKPNLLVTIGDSWTWGDSIDGIIPGVKNDSLERVKKIYGKHIKDYLKTYDWINIGYPGNGNRWIVDVAHRFVNLSTLIDYQHIIIICVLSDTCRDANYGVTDLNIPLESTPSFIKALDNKLFTHLSELDNISNIDLIVARNFTNTDLENLNILKNHVPENWVNFSRLMWNPSYPKLPMFIGYIHNQKILNENLTKSQKEWIVNEYYPIATAVTNFLLECPLHYKRASKHPTEKNHALWADYLIKYMKEKEII